MPFLSSQQAIISIKQNPSVYTQAASMFCVPKPGKLGEVYFITDYKQRNANTVRDNYPLPNTIYILNAIAKGAYRSIINLRDAFFQIRIEPEDEWKTVFK